MSDGQLSPIDEATFEWLVALLDSIDPVGLVIDGNPGREYYYEAREMLPLMSSDIQGEALASRIRAIFVAYFDVSLAGDLGKYTAVADAMIAKRADYEPR